MKDFIIKRRIKMAIDFNYYFIQYKDGKITNLIKKETSDAPIPTDGSRTMRATANEYNLFKAVDKDIEYAKQIIEDWENLLNNNVS
jgi:hypothetical protein